VIGGLWIMRVDHENKQIKVDLIDAKGHVFSSHTGTLIHLSHAIAVFVISIICKENVSVELRKESIFISASTFVDFSINKRPNTAS
jgi:hypothetical protein